MSVINLKFIRNFNLSFHIMERREERLTYPKRPQPLPGRPSRPVSLVSNHYWVKFVPTQKIFIYSLEFSSKIGANTALIKHQIFSIEITSLVMNEIGFFILVDSVVYGARAPSFEQNFSFPATFNDVTYTVTLSLKKSFSIGDIYNPDRKVANPAFKFFNTFLKQMLRSMRLIEFGRSSKFFNPEKLAAIPDTNLRIFHGYLTSFQLYETGSFLKIDVTHKIVRIETVLNFIDDMYNKLPNLSREEKRRKVRESLLNRTVLAIYGNYRYWRVDDLIFDVDCDSFEFDDDKDVQADGSGPRKKYTLTQYYKQRYNMKVTKPRQPLIVNKHSKSNKTFYLLPEFCVMTGIPDDMPDATRKKINDICIKLPHQRMSEVQALMDDMLKSEENKKSFEHLRNMGIEFQPDPVLFEGKQLPSPKLEIGNGELIEGSLTNFQLKKEIYDAGDEIYWAIICNRDFENHKLIKNFEAWAKKLGVNLQPPSVFEYHHDDGKRAVVEIEDILEHKIPGKFDIVIIVLPNYMKQYYKPIKQKCYLKLGILSQVVLLNTLNRKGYHQICSKLIQQVASKVGSKLWVARPPAGLYPSTMLIGVDVSPNKTDKSRSVVAFCASMDATFSKYYSRVVYQKKTDETIMQLRTLIKDALTMFNRLNNSLPQHIIYFRDYAMRSANQMIHTVEIPQIIEGCRDCEMKELPKITVIVIDKHITQKIYLVDNEKELKNPPTGTLVDNTIVSKDYDFYLVAQNVNRGTAVPTHYKIVFDNSELPAEILQELVYSQCFAYMNWSGAIRIPAPCQYAQKLSTFVSQHINEEPLKPLQNYLYYL